MLFLLGMCSALVGGDDDEATTSSPSTTSVPAAPDSPSADPESASRLTRRADPARAPAPEAEAEPAPEPAPGPAPEPEPEADEVPREFQNAVRSAEMYLMTMAFSRQGLINQLEFEQYSPEAAQYAVDAVEADWNEQAVKSGELYLEMMGFSRQGLIDQLTFDGYTPDQAQYAADQLF
ncbi:Ltp family lipoprotein [Dietzia aerolata]|uniref:Ltp family lipoprotein n=1 Tax=Dietzia aerolata TaxID=595984 RepID=UPI00363E2B50